MNDATDPGIVAARARVDALLGRLSRAELGVIVVDLPDDDRLDAEDRARAAAEAAQRGELLDVSRADARELAMRAFAKAGFSGTWALTDMAVSVARSGDRVAAAIAFEDAATAEVVEDLVDDETLETLRSASDQLLGMTGLPTPGSISAIATPLEMEGRGLVAVVALALLLLAAAAVAFVVGGRAGLIALALSVAMLIGLWRRRGRTAH